MNCDHRYIETGLRNAYEAYVSRKGVLNKDTGASGQQYLGWGKWDKFYINVGVSKINTPYLMITVKKPYRDLIDGHVYPHQILLFSNFADKSFTCRCKEKKVRHEQLFDILRELINYQEKSAAPTP